MVPSPITMEACPVMHRRQTTAVDAYSASLGTVFESPLRKRSMENVSLENIIAASSFDEKRPFMFRNDKCKIEKRMALALRTQPRTNEICNYLKKSVENAQSTLMFERWFRQRMSEWVQCSGHSGTILPATDCTIWKRCSSDRIECEAYRKLMKDACSCFVPKFYAEENMQGQIFLELEDLTKKFTNPAVMDIKLGTRTFLECEVKNSKKRDDLYEKMVALDPMEPTEEEHADGAITKLRYMQFREQQSSSSSLGFRVEAVKKRGEKSLNKSFKNCKTKNQVVDVLSSFLGDNNEIVRRSLLRRLRTMRDKIEISPFFNSHEVVGSSLLILFDGTHASAFLIDFAKTVPLPDDVKVNHRSHWRLGNHEDGYLTGLDNLIDILEKDVNNVRMKC